MRNSQGLKENYENIHDQYLHLRYGYNFEEVKQKVFSVLSQNYAGLSGIELSSKTKINRMTLTKYLSLMLAQGLIRKKNWNR